MGGDVQRVSVAAPVSAGASRVVCVICHATFDSPLACACCLAVLAHVLAAQVALAYARPRRAAMRNVSGIWGADAGVGTPIALPLSSDGIITNDAELT
jgi:hypothetical protein